MSRPEGDAVRVRVAGPKDVPALCGFGAAHLPPHYTPLIGASAAQGQVRSWWAPEVIGAAVEAGLVVVAVADGQVIGVGERGRFGDDHVIYKLYVHPGHRGRRLGPQLVEALVRQLPPGTDRVYIEHFAANVRAGEFYQREGFTVRRIEEAPGDDRGLDVVWRARDLAGQQEARERQAAHGPPARGSSVSPSTSCRRSPRG